MSLVATWCLLGIFKLARVFSHVTYSLLHWVCTFVVTVLEVYLTSLDKETSKNTKHDRKTLGKTSNLNVKTNSYQSSDFNLSKPSVSSHQKTPKNSIKKTDNRLHISMISEETGISVTGVSITAPNTVYCDLNKATKIILSYECFNSNDAPLVRSYEILNPQSNDSIQNFAMHTTDAADALNENKRNIILGTPLSKSSECDKLELKNLIISSVSKAITRLAQLSRSVSEDGPVQDKSNERTDNSSNMGTDYNSKDIRGGKSLQQELNDLILKHLEKIYAPYQKHQKQIASTSKGAQHSNPSEDSAKPSDQTGDSAKPSDQTGDSAKPSDQTEYEQEKDDLHPFIRLLVGR